MGLETLLAPLFTVRPVEWQSPAQTEVDCVLLTSANAARHAGPQMEAFTSLPCFAVGESSAVAARDAGFAGVRTGNDDAAALLSLAADAGLKRPLHLCGRDHIAAEHPRLSIKRRIVYAADAAEALTEPAVEALRSGAVALLHSPRAAALFARLADEAGLERRGIPLAALSAAVAASAGDGWAEVVSAPRPSDDALLELAAKLCKTGPSATGNSG
jgi:uroporphyrinogen-III synthase